MIQSKLGNPNPSSSMPPMPCLLSFPVLEPSAATVQHTRSSPSYEPDRDKTTHVPVATLLAYYSPCGAGDDDFASHAAGHTVGLAHCGTFSGRLRGPSAPDPTLDRGYAAQLQAECPANADPRAAVSMDPVTPVAFDNQYFRNLQAGKGLLASDQVLHTDPRSRPTVDAWARSAAAFDRAFVAAITKLGRVGVKTGGQGNIRRNCAVLN